MEKGNAYKLLGCGWVSRVEAPAERGRDTRASGCRQGRTNFDGRELGGFHSPKIELGASAEAGQDLFVGSEYR